MITLQRLRRRVRRSTVIAVAAMAVEVTHSIKSRVDCHAGKYLARGWTLCSDRRR